MDIVMQEHYKKALQKSMAQCPCRWWLQRYMVLTPVRHDQRDYKPGNFLDGWQMSVGDIAGLLAGGAIGMVDTRPTGISTNVAEALAQAERLISVGVKERFDGMARPQAAYYGYADKRHLTVWRVDDHYYIHEFGVDDEDDAEECESMSAVEIVLGFDKLVSPKEGWRPCFARLPRT